MSRTTDDWVKVLEPEGEPMSLMTDDWVKVSAPEGYDSGKIVCPANQAPI